MPFSAGLLSSRSSSSGPNVDRYIKQTRGNDTNCSYKMATMQRNENIRKLFETKKKLTKSSQDVMTMRNEKNIEKEKNITCPPRSISYTNLANASNVDDDDDYDDDLEVDNENETTTYSRRLKGPWALSQSNGQIANQQQHVQDVAQNDVFDYGSSNRKLNSRRNSSTNNTTTTAASTSATAPNIKRWHVGSYNHKGNDVTKDLKLAKSLLRQNQLAKSVTTAAEQTMATSSTYSSSTALTQQHNQLVAGYMKPLSNSFHHIPFNLNDDATDKNFDNNDDCDVQRPKTDNNYSVASTPRLNNNCRESCPAATSSPTPTPTPPPHIRKPSAQWFKRKNWISQDDDDIIALGYHNNNNAIATTTTTNIAGGISLDNALHHWDFDRTPMNYPGYKQYDVKPSYNSSAGITATTNINKNVNNYCWPNGKQPENYITNYRRKSITNNNNNKSNIMLHENASSNEYLNLYRNYAYGAHHNDNVDDEDFFHYEHSNDKDNMAKAIENYKEDNRYLYNKDVTLKDAVFKNEMPLGQSQEYNENSNQQLNPMPLNSLGNCQPKEILSSPMMRTNLKATQIQNEKIITTTNQPQILNSTTATLRKYSMSPPPSMATNNSQEKSTTTATTLLSRQIPKYNIQRTSSPDARPTSCNEYIDNNTITPTTKVYLANVSHDDDNGFSYHDDDDNDVIDNVENAAGVGFLHQQKYLPTTSACYAVTPVNEYKDNNNNNNNNINNDQNPLLNPSPTSILLLKKNAQ